MWLQESKELIRVRARYGMVNGSAPFLFLSVLSVSVMLAGVRSWFFFSGRYFQAA